MPSLTISEALGQIQVIDQHIARKQKLVEAYLLRDASVRDPLQADGGTQALLAREMRAIEALQERKVLIRRAVQQGNERARITHEEQTRSVADWLVWKREVVARRSQFLAQLRSRIDQARRETALLSRASAGGPARPNDVVVNLNEKDLAGAIEALEERQGYLAGQLTLKNATTAVELPGDETWQTGLEGRIDELLARAGASVPVAGGLAVWLDGLADFAMKIMTIKVVREITGCGLAEAKNLVEGAPRPVRENLSRDDAEGIKKRLEAAGGRVSIR